MSPIDFAILRSELVSHFSGLLLSKSMVRLVRAEKMVWSGLCAKDSQDDFDSECVGFDGSPGD